MKSTSSRWWLFLLLPLAALALLTLSGCNSDTPSVEPNPTVAPAQPTRREKVEPMAESSGELSRRHIYDQYDREVETHINFRNGERASYYFRENGSAREYVLQTKSGQIKTRKVYGLDGKTVVEGQESRYDGSPKWVLERMKDGSSKTTTYWYDGKRVFSEEVTKADGSFETTYYRKGGSVWIKKSGKGAKVTAEEHFDKNGTQTMRVEFPADDISVVTVFTGGKAVARQTWKVEKTSWGSAAHTLQSVEELDSNGKVTRKLKLNYSGWTVEQTETYNADGTRLVRTLRWDGTVSKEETFDQAGKSTNVKDFKDDERLYEQVDRSLMQRSYPDDPVNNWDLQEKYPYYRERDE